MGIRSFFQSASRLLKLATKPGRTELWLSLKICFIGVIAIGGIGFLIKIIFMGVNGLLG
ncbi:protein translocase SEC61 complex subunit gamma [Candidatus Bathyarchaeota archaeon]|nr:protein translocase SEC61 complex subunit gamma [Candidatus Bathyarchaeota archaeon]